MLKLALPFRLLVFVWRRRVVRFIAYSFGGDLVGAAKTNSTARNQLIDGATDNRAIKDAVGDSLTDNNTSKKELNSFDDRRYKPKPGERTLDGIC